MVGTPINRVTVTITPQDSTGTVETFATDCGQAGRPWCGVTVRFLDRGAIFESHA